MVIEINRWSNSDVVEMERTKQWMEENELPCCDYCGGERKRSLLSSVGAYRLCESCATLSVEERNEVKEFQARKEALNKELDDQIKAAKRRHRLNIDSDAEELIENNSQPDIPVSSTVNHCEECPDSKVIWNGHQWNASTEPPGFASRIKLEVMDIKVERLKDISEDNAICTKPPVNHCKDCPDSKYEGSLWEYCGEGFRVSWDGHQWNARCTNQRAIYVSIFEDVDPVAMEIEGFWNLIEYGGCISTHEKPKPLKRNPNKAPKIKVPWDPYTV